MPTLTGLIVLFMMNDFYLQHLSAQYYGCCGDDGPYRRCRPFWRNNVPPNVPFAGPPNVPFPGPPPISPPGPPPIFPPGPPPIFPPGPPPIFPPGPPPIFPPGPSPIIPPRPPPRPGLGGFLDSLIPPVVRPAVGTFVNPLLGGIIGSPILRQGQTQEQLDPGPIPVPVFAHPAYHAPPPVLDPTYALHPALFPPYAYAPPHANAPPVYLQPPYAPVYNNYAPPPGLGLLPTYNENLDYNNPDYDIPEEAPVIRAV